MRVLVTGAAGYVGSVLTAHLLKTGHEVVAFDKCIYGAESLLAFSSEPDFKLVAGDVRDVPALKEAVAGADSVVHMAAVVGEPACSVDPEAAYEINSLGTKNVLEAAQGAGVKRFVYFSTCSNYGVSDPDTITNEASPLRPLSSYAKSKVQAEEHIFQSGSSVGSIILRFATICGLSPRMRFDLLVSELARSAVLGHEIDIFAPAAWRPFIHVHDAARAVLTSLNASPNSNAVPFYNVVGENYQKQGLADLVRKHFPSASIKIVEKAPDIRDYKVSADKIKMELSYSPVHTVEEAFLETAKAVACGAFRNPMWSGHSAIPDDPAKLAREYAPL